MRSRTDAADEVAVVARTGRSHVKNIRVEQRVTDAPLMYLQLFDHASPTVGTTAPVMVLQIPAGVANLDAAVYDYVFGAKRGGIEFGTALSYAVTKGHDDAVAPDAGDEPVVIVDFEPLG